MIPSIRSFAEKCGLEISLEKGKFFDQLMKLHLWIVSVFSLFLTVEFTTADQIDPKSVPADADWYFHVNLDQLSNGKLGDWMSELGDLFILETGEESPLKYFTDEDDNVSGGLTFYGSGGKPENSVIRAVGLNDAESLIAEIEGAKDYKKSSIGNLTIHSWVEEAKGKMAEHNPGEIRVYGTFLDDSTMIASQSEETLGEAIDFHRNPKAGIKKPANADVAILGSADLVAIARDGGHSARMLGSAKRMESRMKVAADGSISGTVRVETSDAESAKKMFMMIDGMIAFGSTYAEPGTWNPGENMQAAQKGSAVEVKMNLPIADLEKIKTKIERGKVEA